MSKERTDIHVHLPGSEGAQKNRDHWPLPIEGDPSALPGLRFVLFDAATKKNPAYNPEDPRGIPEFIDLDNWSSPIKQVYEHETTYDDCGYYWFAPYHVRYTYFKGDQLVPQAVIESEFGPDNEDRWVRKPIRFVTDREDNGKKRWDFKARDEQGRFAFGHNFIIRLKDVNGNTKFEISPDAEKDGTVSGSRKGSLKQQDFTDTKGDGGKVASPPLKKHHLQVKEVGRKAITHSAHTWGWIEPTDVFFNSFDTSDTENIKVTREPRYDADPVEVPFLLAFNNQEHEIHLVPRQVAYYARGKLVHETVEDQTIIFTSSFDTTCQAPSPWGCDTLAEIRGYCASSDVPGWEISCSCTYCGCWPQLEVMARQRGEWGMFLLNCQGTGSAKKETSHYYGHAFDGGAAWCCTRKTINFVSDYISPEEEETERGSDRVDRCVGRCDTKILSISSNAPKSIKDCKGHCGGDPWEVRERNTSHSSHSETWYQEFCTTTHAYHKIGIWYDRLPHDLMFGEPCDEEITAKVSRSVNKSFVSAKLKFVGDEGYEAARKNAVAAGVSEEEMDNVVCGMNSIHVHDIDGYVLDPWMYMYYGRPQPSKHETFGPRSTPDMKPIQTTDPDLYRGDNQYVGAAVDRAFPLWKQVMRSKFSPHVTGNNVPYGFGYVSNKKGTLLGIVRSGSKSFFIWRKTDEKFTLRSPTGNLHNFGPKVEKTEHAWKMALDPSLVIDPIVTWRYVPEQWEQTGGNAHGLGTDRWVANILPMKYEEAGICELGIDASGCRLDWPQLRGSQLGFFFNIGEDILVAFARQRALGFSPVAVWSHPVGTYFDYDMMSLRPQWEDDALNHDRGYPMHWEGRTE